MSNKENEYGFGYGTQISGGVNYDQSANQPVQTPQTAAPQGTMPATPNNSPAAGGNLLNPASEPVRDITTDEFSSEVIQASNERPVLIDFWAPWCEPCKQLAPALEAAVAKTGGKVKLVKMNIDEHPQVAGQMGIQSIPAVVAFVEGKPKDAFMGAKSAREIDQFIEKIAGPSGPSQLELALEQAASLMSEGAFQEAGQLYGSILSQVPDNMDAIAGYGHALLKLGHLDEARKAAEMAPENSSHIALDSLKTAIELEEQAASIGDFSQLEADIAKDPKNHEARFDLAIALNGAGQGEAAANHLLEIIANDRQWRDDGAKAQLLQFFEAWGPMDPKTLDARRRLSSLLFS